MGTIANAYFAIDLHPEPLQAICEGLQKALAEFGIPVSNANTQAHVSIAYALGEYDVQDVWSIAKAISSDNFQTGIGGVEILEGLTTPFDYIAVTLKECSGFRHAVNLIRKNMTVKNFEGGFKAHISLFRVPKGVIDRERAKRLSHYLNLCCHCLRSNLKISGEAVSVFNDEKQRQMRLPLYKAS